MSLLWKGLGKSNEGRERERERERKGLEKERLRVLSRKEARVSWGLGNEWFGMRLGRSAGSCGTDCFLF